jgi:hypothetical protein
MSQNPQIIEQILKSKPKSKLYFKALDSTRILLIIFGALLILLSSIFTIFDFSDAISIGGFNSDWYNYINFWWLSLPFLTSLLILILYRQTDWPGVRHPRILWLAGALLLITISTISFAILENNSQISNIRNSLPNNQNLEAKFIEKLSSREILVGVVIKQKPGEFELKTKTTKEKIYTQNNEILETNKILLIKYIQQNGKKYFVTAIKLDSIKDYIQNTNN